MQTQNKSVTIHVEKAGTLPTLIEESEKYQITELKLTGNLNGTDIAYIRDMAGCNSNGEPTSGVLSTLDFSDTNIISGGTYYLKHNDTSLRYVSDNTIGTHAFWKCTSLTKVIISNRVNSIEADAFKSTYLNSVIIPNSVTSIGGGAFGGCVSLTNITIPNSVTSIGNSAFSGCRSLTNVTIPNSVTIIGNWAFDRCSNLKSIKIPDSVTSIEQGAFRGCTSLTNITIPNSVTGIGSGAFGYCTSLTSVTIGNSVVTIGEEAFWCCTSLRSVTIGNSITTIEKWAFKDCRNITEIHINNPVPQTINRHSFYNVNKNACKVYVPKGSYDAYRKTSFWGKFGNIIEYADKDSTNTQCAIKTIHVETAGTLLQLIAKNEKYQITNLTLTGNLNGTDIRYIREMAGRTYDNKPTEGKLSVLDLSDANIVSGGDSYHTSYSASSQEHYTTDNTIGDYAFYNCTGLTSMAIPNSVTTIGKFVFGYYNTSLTRVTIGNSVTSIGCNAFNSCSSLTSITIPNSVTSIETGAFYDCKSLTSITIPNGVTHIEGSAFSGCERLKKFVVSKENKSFSVIDGILFNKDRTTLICYPNAKSDVCKIPNSVTSIGGDAFRGCTGLTSITIPNSVTNIGERAFASCTDLTNVTISNNVTSIERSAFAACTRLTSVTIPDNVTNIGEFAFANCYRLTNVTIPNSVTNIGEGAFGGCKNLEKIHNNNPIPQIIEKRSFNNVNMETCKLFVSKGSYNAYKNASVWGEFKNIIEE